MSTRSKHLAKSASAPKIRHYVRNADGEGNVNTAISFTVGPIVDSTVVVPTAGSSDVAASSLSLAVADKLDHLANAVSAIDSRLRVIGNKVQELKVKSNSSRAWDDVLNLSRVSAMQEPPITQPIANPSSNCNNVP